MDLEERQHPLLWCLNSLTRPEGIPLNWGLGVDFERTQIIEFWKYRSDTNVQIEDSEHGNDFDFKSWTTEPRPTRNGENPEAGMRMVILTGFDCSHFDAEHPERTPTTRRLLSTVALDRYEQFKHVLADFHFPEAVVISFSGVSIGYRKFPGDPNPDSFVADCHVFESLTWAMAWSWDPVERLTRCITVSRSTSPESFKDIVNYRVPAMIYELQDWVYYQGFMSLVLGLCVLAFAHSSRAYLFQQETIATYESALDETQMPYLAMLGLPEHHGAVNYGALSGRVATRIFSINGDYQRLKALKVILDFTRKADKNLLDPSYTSDCKIDHEKNLQLVYTACDTLDQMADDLLYGADSLRENGTVQLQMIFNRIAQRDSKISLEVAEASRMLAFQSQRDSSSMKTLAFVTMFYLPASFVASLFDIPMFNWDGNGAPDVSSQFWIFWAVAIPLTIVTYGSWLLWWYTRLRRDKTIREKQRVEMEAEAAKLGS